MSNESFDLKFLQENFNLPQAYQSFEILNNGHINSTFVLTFLENGADSDYVVQKINTHIFKDPDALMNNIIGVTQFLQKKIAARGGDISRETLHFLQAKNGKYFATDEQGCCWRCYHHIGGVYTCNIIDSEEVFRNAGTAFGAFQKALADYPSETLVETIPNFHNTYSRFLDFKKAVADNLSGRLANVEKEVQFILDREADTHVLLDLIDKGELPIRVTHNDTKLNNILFDVNTNKGICIIDLDTVMPGLSLYDFGDSIRFGANTAAEDEQDISKVSLSLPLYKAYVEGYLCTAKDSLWEAEIAYLPFSAKLMTFECGMRFLTDYLNGDTYFKTAYPEHNLVRTRTQLALVKDIEDKMDEMVRITQEATK